jgi:predicted dehydrogenase
MRPVACRACFCAMSKKRRFILVGCGSISGSWLVAVENYFSDRLELAGLVDLNEKNAFAQAHRFAPGRSVWTGTSLEVALAEVKPDIVFNCTVPEAHAFTCKTALLAGCDVLVEKPLAPTVAEARELVALCAETGKQLVVIQNRRYSPGIVAVKRALEEGVIGPVHTIHSDFFVGPHFGGFRERMAHPLLLDMAIHTFDQARYLTGLNPTRVVCHEFNPPGSWFSQGASAVALFEMAGGAVYTYRGSWCAQGEPTSWDALWRIIGGRGSLLWDGAEAISLERVVEPLSGQAYIHPVKRVTLSPVPLGDAGAAHAGNIGEFLASLDSGQPAQTVARDNLFSLAMVEGAVKSAESGGFVTL